MMRDAQSKTVRMVEADAFTVGKDLATTPGAVVFRNRLVELIHYTPTTDKVQDAAGDRHAVDQQVLHPDLTAKKSMVKRLTDQGFRSSSRVGRIRRPKWQTRASTTICARSTRWCRLPASSAGATGGARRLLHRRHAGFDPWFWANRHYGEKKMPVVCWTLFTTLTDFEARRHRGLHRRKQHPLAGAVDGEEGLPRRWRDGFQLPHAALEQPDLALLQNSYLYGEPLPPFDVLFWNMDTTRMPQAMHSFTCARCTSTTT